MARFLRRRSSSILAFVLVVVLALGIFGFISLFKKVDNLELTKTVSSSAYARGLLDDNTGKLPQDSSDINYSGIRMKQFVNVDGLKCELVDKAKIKYAINFYDENYDFIVYPDYIENSINLPIDNNINIIKIPSHTNVPLNPIKRVAKRYELLETKLCMKH